MNGGCRRTVVGCWNWRDSNISLVGVMRREGDKTIPRIVGSNAQTIEMKETPEEILAIHLGALEVRSF
jgi:hypothetical protein